MAEAILIKRGGSSGGTGSDELTAKAGDVLAGKTAVTSDSNDEAITGTMANQGAASQVLNAGGSYTIPAGYHNGLGKVTANSLAAQTGVDSGKTAAAAAQILTGYQAWVNGSKVSGNMANQGAKTSALNCGGSYTIPAGYHNGSGKVTANSLAAQTAADAAAGDILTGKTAWVNGAKVTGTLPTKAGSTITPSASAQTIAVSGYKMTSDIIVDAIPSGLYGVEITSPAEITADSGTICNLGTSGWEYVIVTGHVRVGGTNSSEFDYSLGFVRNPSADFTERLRDSSSSGFVTFTMSKAGILSFTNSQSAGYHSNLKVYKFVKKY